MVLSSSFTNSSAMEDDHPAHHNDLADAVNFSGASVYRATSDQSVSSATLTAIEFNAESYDTDSYHDNATNNSRLTVPTNGKYRVEGAVTLESVGSGDIQIRLDVNGSHGRQVLRLNSGSYSALTYSFSTILVLSASDYVEVVVFDAAGSFTVRDDEAWTSVQITRLEQTA